MVDDYGKPGVDLPDKHSCDGKPKDFCEPPNMGDVVWRLPEAITDPASNQLSMSRIVFGVVGFSVAFAVVYETLSGRVGTIFGSVAAIMATIATVYSLSTVKDFRFWRDRRDKEGPQ